MKRVISLLLTFAVLLTMVCTGISAAENVVLKVSADKNTAKIGDTIDFEVTIGKVASLGVLEFTLNIPSGMEIVADSIVIPSGLEATLDSDGSIVLPSEGNGYKWAYNAQATGYTGTADLVLLTFSCLATTAGEKNVSINLFDICDNIDVETLPTTINSAKITVEAPHTCTFTQKTVSNATLKSKADCENAAVYYYSCTCGAISDSEFFTYGSALGHAASGWKTNDSQHWKVCTRSNCGEEIANSRGNHADNDGNYFCDVCRFNMTPDHVCEFDQEVTSDDALKSAADCEDAAEYYYSCTCGAISDSEFFTYGEALGHDESGWKTNSQQHWKICTECREEIEGTLGDHEDDDDDGECDICDYDLDRYDDDDDIGGDHSNPFLDIFFLGSGSNAAIDYVYRNSLFEGVSKYEFAPNMTMTRGMFVTVLGRMAGINPEAYGGSSFYDVDPGAWYAPGVAWATQNGIIMGYGNGSFGVNDEITVEQAVVILERYARYIGIDTTTDYSLIKFSDRNFVSSWAYEPMQWAVEQDIYDGKGKSLVPQKAASRALVAELIYNFATEYVE